MEDYGKKHFDEKPDHKPTPFNRRDFIKLSTTAAVAAVVTPIAIAKSTKMPLRTLGRTGEKISVLTLGGHHLGQKDVPEEVAINIIRTAIDEGVNFLDNAWSYQQGRSEERMGKALKDGYRKKVLIMTKLMARSVEEAKTQLETSVKRWDLDSVDLMQFHAVSRDGMNVVDDVYNKGLIEWAMEQRDQGVFKYIGFTGHSNPKPLAEMMRRGFEFDTMQCPVNIGDHHQDVSFEKEVLPMAVERNIGILAMKTNGFGLIGKSGVATPAECIRYALDQPISTLVSGVDSMKILWENLAAAKAYTPFTKEEKEALLARAKNTTEKLEHYRKA
ncbi:MAG: putative aldo/keto reductase-like oxidoreductase [Cyclobacteriaceae bacterium]|jgi:predicted aldo/keto reductase-like oxidoreductase